MLGVFGLNLTIFKAPNVPMSQHGATGRPNALNMLRPTTLPDTAVAFTFFDRLAGA